MPGEESESENAARNVRERVGTNPLVLLASAGKGRARPSTANTIAQFASEFAAPERERVLVVTSAIYAPYQFFRAAPLLLSSGTTYVELVGAPTLSNERALPQQLGQEIHAAIDAALELLR